MPVIPFADWKPDLSPYKAQSSQLIQNVFPRLDGYGPVASVSQYSQALPGPCRGYFYARNADQSVTVFAATASKLYKLNNTDFSWTDVSKGAGSYTAVGNGEQWQFAQFNNFVIAVQINTVPQVFDLTSSSAFADLGGSPPQARYVAVVNRFVVLSGLGTSTPYRVQWSGLNAVTTWTSGVNSSDFQDLPDGGVVRAIGGGETGLITQDASLRRMIYAPGAPYVFQIDRVAQDKGIFAPLSLVRAGDRLFFCGNDGFYMILPGGYPVPIGKERFDRTFFADVDAGQLHLVIGASDPRATRVYWTYKSQAGSAGLFDKILVYDYGIERAALIVQSGEYLATLARPGLTLEGLDQLAAGAISITGVANNGSGAIRLTLASEIGNWTYGFADTGHSVGQAGTTNLSDGSQDRIEVYGITGTTEANGNWAYTVIDATHIDLVGSIFTNAYVSGGPIAGALDALTFSLDDVATSALAQLSIVDSSHKLGFFGGPIAGGPALEATLDTAEQTLDRRMRVKGFRPMTDAPTCYGSIGARENLQSSVSYSTEQPVNSKGLCPANVSTRLARGRVRIPAGTAWTFASGVEPTTAQEGVR